MIGHKVRAALAAIGVAAIMLAAPAAARAATINVILVDVTSCGAGCWDWEYMASQDPVARTTDGAEPGVTTSINSDEFEVADYFTIYDFAGFVGVQQEGDSGEWDSHTFLTGSTPGQVLPSDDPNIINITFWFVGPNLAIGDTRQGPWDEGGFVIRSTFGPETEVMDSYTSEDTNENSTTNQAIGSVRVPSELQVPEPGSLLLLGMGLVGLAGAARRRMRK